VTWETARTAVRALATEGLVHMAEDGAAYIAGRD
jgi:hypothetical protein